MNRSPPPNSRYASRTPLTSAYRTGVASIERGGYSVAGESLSGESAEGADMQPADQHRRIMAAMMMAAGIRVMTG